jgi:hypothetical protein
MGAPVDWGAGLFAFAGLVLLAVMLLAFFEWYLSRKWADKSAEESKGVEGNSSSCPIFLSGRSIRF